MKFKISAGFEIDNETLLDIVNNYQEFHDFEVFDDFEEIPMELIWLALNWSDEIDYQITILSTEDYNIIIDEEN